MCVILYIPAHKSVSFANIKNASLNNPHGFGLVTVDRGKLEVFKHLREKGNDPDFVMERLVDAVNHDRFLHLRYNTAGDTVEANQHPFTVFNNVEGNKHIEFMHNGTLHDFKVQGSGDSDTKNFAENVVSPLLYRLQGDNGLGDIHDPLFQSIIKRYMIGSRGLLISNQQEPVFIGDWKKLKDAGEEFLVSNDDYFRSLQSHRVPDWAKPHQVHNQGNPYRPFNPGQESVGGKVVNTGDATGNALVTTEDKSKEVTQLKDVNLKPVERFLKPDDIADLYSNGTEVIDDEDIAFMVHLSTLELCRFAKDKPIQAARMMEFIIGRFSDLYSDLDKVSEKHRRSTEHNATLQGKIEELASTRDELMKLLDDATKSTNVVEEEKAA